MPFNAAAACFREPTAALYFSTSLVNSRRKYSRNCFARWNSEVYRPVGANREERADVRIVAATNRDLERSVLRGEFRADLYYRINVLQIVAPPLRKHRGDIPQIVGAILGELLLEGSKVRVTESVMAELLHAPWPGNVRELKNVLRRSLVMSSKGGDRAPRKRPPFV